MTVVFLLVSTKLIHWKSRLLYKLTRLYFNFSNAFMVPNAPLLLGLLTRARFSAAHVAVASVRASVLLFEKQMYIKHPLGPAHSKLLGASQASSWALLSNLFTQCSFCHWKGIMH